MPIRISDHIARLDADLDEIDEQLRPRPLRLAWFAALVAGLCGTAARAFARLHGV